MTCWGDDEPDPPSDRPKVRGCTDVFWLVIYISFWFLMIMIAGFALAYGNPRRLVNGYDSFGNTCGAEYNEKIGNFSLTGLNMTSKKYLLFFNMANVGQSMDICVEKCPDRDLLTLDDLRSFYKETGSKLCRYDFDILGENKDSLHGLNESLLVSSAYGPCPLLPVKKSTPIMNRCVPVTIVEPVKNIVHGVFDLLNSWDFVEQVLGDLYATWHYILAMTFLALILSLIVISLFYFFANIVSFIVMTTVCIASLVGCTIVWWTYYDIKVELDNTPSEQLLEEAIQNERAFFLYGIISSVITAVILLLVCSMRRNLSFLADLFKEASECLSALPSLYLQPILSFVLLLLFYSFWVLVVVCLATANYPGIRPIRPFSLDLDPMLAASASASQPASPDLLSALPPPPANISVVTHKAFTLVQYADALWVRYMWSVYLVALVWVSQFVLSCQQMVVAGAVARWYFNGWKKTTKSPVLTSFRHMICYHLGTMAKGSLLITIFKLPRLILTYLHTKFKKSEEISSCARCGLKSCICCFWCLENFIRYINHNAYTVVAMQGINFCPAAARAFHILMSNAIQFAIINSMGDFILFLGKVIVTAITGSVGLLLIKNNEHLYFYSAPTLVICVFAYFIAHSVISLYEIVIDTLFLCVCEDQNMNGEAGRWRERTLSSIRSTNGSSNSRMVPELKPINS